ncbi:adenosylcobinamide-phosphate synthase CbiB [Paludibacterium yongneupense]|uniref:adenosylcobinamide-phosphate synthase CbiB n=1 Tax=Paludibacterium yongneupense TaxID=400061 RepID=UPI00040C7144|nr:adenosylcobinamide-phosphate synthase CbiB [Paludibacterium yongneupense]
MLLFFTLLGAVLLDRVCGEPRRWHPLVGFGRLATRVEARLRRRPRSPRSTRAAGLLGWLVLLLPPTVLAGVLARQPLIAPVVNVLLLYLCIAPRSLNQHALAVGDALVGKDLLRARDRVAMIVSRDTRRMHHSDVARATIESVLENGSDAVFAALFWYIVAGAPGVVLYRLANTLDAMWGYRNERFLHFGWAAARLDDVLNYVPARLTAISYCLLGDFRRGWRCWRTQAPTWYSPNAGPVMAAGAGALALELGGPAYYHGKWKARPLLGQGRAPDGHDIRRALGLVNGTIVLWLAAACVGGCLSLWL